MARLLFTVSFIWLTACTSEDHYPISGKECCIDSPVHNMDANDFKFPAWA